MLYQLLQKICHQRPTRKLYIGAGQITKDSFPNKQVYRIEKRHRQFEEYNRAYCGYRVTAGEAGNQIGKGMLTIGMGRKSKAKPKATPWAIFLGEPGKLITVV